MHKKLIGKPEQWLVTAASSVGLDYSELSHEITDEFIEHSMKRHGDRSLHGAATITAADFDLIPDIVKNPDYAVIGAIRKETLVNAYAKTCNGMTYLYFEDVMKSRKNKVLRGKTLYKITRLISFDEFQNNVTRNNKTDISKAAIVSA
ncbi:MAG: hypothetical protein FWC06_08890 [Treponema sp.]|nr:hypothetical protein [Treponema sp.]